MNSMLEVPLLILKEILLTVLEVEAIVVSPGQHECDVSYAASGTKSQTVWILASVQCLLHRTGDLFVLGNSC